MQSGAPDKSEFCCYCGKKFSHCVFATKDHLIPLSKGGANNSYNKKNCCRHCNTEKGDFMPYDYLLFIQHKALEKPNYHLEIKIENIKYIIQYVNTAGDKIFKNRTKYVWFERRYLNQKIS